MPNSSHQLYSNYLPRAVSTDFHQEYPLWISVHYHRYRSNNPSLSEYRELIATTGLRLHSVPRQYELHMHHIPELSASISTSCSTAEYSNTLDFHDP